MATRRPHLILPISTLLALASGCASDPSTYAPEAQAYLQASAQSAELQDNDRVVTCLLGTSCMELEAKPFEVCLLGAASCPSKPEVVQAVESTLTP